MFERILVPLDGSSIAECVLPHAVALANVFGARVTLLQVLEAARGAAQVQPATSVDWHIRRAEARAYVDEVSVRLRQAGLRTETAVREGDAAQRILEFARTDGSDLIILSSHGLSGLSGWNVSSVVQKIIQRLYTPTMIVRAYHSIPNGLENFRYRRVMVPLDGSKRAECALPLAEVLARRHGAQLLVAHVVSRPEMPRHAPLTQEDVELVDRITERNRAEAERYLAQLLSRIPSDVETHLLVSDNAAEALHDLVAHQDVDLVALSAHGYSGSTKWPYGSMALSFIVYGATPLLIAQDVSPAEIEPTHAEIASREYKGH